MIVINKNFIYQVADNALEYNQDNVVGIFGEGATVNSDFREDVMATMAAGNIYDVFKDAISQCLMLKMQHMGRVKCDYEQMVDSDKRFQDFLGMKIKKYETMQNSIIL